MEQKEQQTESLVTFNNKLTEWRQSVKADELKLLQFYKQDLTRLYRECDGWLLRTLYSKGIKEAQIKNANYIVVVGSGFVPYSILNCHRYFPKVKYIGIDNDEKAVTISKRIIDQIKLENIEIYNAYSMTYDYSFLTQEDIVFISNDITEPEILYERIIMQSPCQVYYYLPYKKAPN